jgi:hypothetical protein
LQHQLTTLQQTVAARQQEIAVESRANARLQREWTQLPRESELAELAQALAEVDAEIAADTDGCAALAAQVEGLAALRQRLAALDDPRSRSAVASAQAAQRPQLETRLKRERSKQIAAEQQIETIDQELARWAISTRRWLKTPSNCAHSAAYQTVLTHRQLAATLPDAAAEVAELSRLWKRHICACGKPRGLKVAVEQFDQEHYQRVLLDDRKMREELGSLSASIRLMLEAQAACCSASGGAAH